MNGLFLERNEVDKLERADRLGCESVGLSLGLAGMLALPVDWGLCAFAVQKRPLVPSRVSGLK